MENNYQRDIIGIWENESIKYIFHENGEMEIYWKSTNGSSMGKYEIDKDIITFIYGNQERTWMGEINHISKSHLSILDCSHQVGVVDVLYSSSDSLYSVDAIDDPAENTPPPKEKFRAIDILWVILGLGFFLTIFGFIGYLVYQDFVTHSHQVKYFTFGCIALYIFIIGLILSDIEMPEGKLFDLIRKNPLLSCFVIPYALYFIVPVFAIIAGLIILFLELWFYWVCILITIFVFQAWVSNSKRFKKILVSIVALVSIYFLYESKDILQFTFSVKFDDESIFKPNSD
ncbi:hypothetical protein FEDK69T_08010 [Flavobacterium enshiense DK69]|uniref:Uncharacterized protein n=1 Tax=Flavobacterium enshiense DK69 TaxID=1107311 RepID=V6SIW0_9FLAO|nr:hypothetical protein [Flavobacterium enshiense]ESU24355.1 hypothetical protein FEDK69T_08010 [Flavobacterium enshiense DK69]KGO94461.1 hypothetical protein Q767_12895 [Flavobacterium enshiense DK69]